MESDDLVLASTRPSRERVMKKGGLEMENPVDYEGKIEELTRVCDAKIEELRACSQEATPELKAKMDREISELIANREALRRGLVKPDDEGGFCSSCPK